MARPLNRLYSDPEICPKNPKAADISKNWFVQFRYYNSVTGKWELQVFKKGINYYKNFKERLASANALKEFLRERLEKGWNPITNTMPVEHALNPLENNIARLPLNAALAFALRECKVSPATLKEYRSTVQRIKEVSGRVLTPVADGSECYLDFSTVPIGQIRKYHIKLMLEQCYRQFGWSDKNWNKHLGYLQGILSRLVQHDVWEHNPAHDIPFLNVPESDKYQSLSKEEKKIIREHIFLHHYGYFVYLMTLYHTGLRPFEALALQLRDIKLEERVIKIVKSRSRHNSKTSSIRHVPINDHLWVLLKQWIAGYDIPELYVFGSPYTSGRGNAGSAKGGLTGAMHPDYFKPSMVRIKRDTVTRLWKKIVRDSLGIDHYMYDLKFTGGDDKIMAGVDLDALRDLYGHQNKRMTERYVKRLREVYSEEIRKKSPAF